MISKKRRFRQYVDIFGYIGNKFLFKVISKQRNFPRNVDICGFMDENNIFEYMGKVWFLKVILKLRTFSVVDIFGHIGKKNIFSKRSKKTDLFLDFWFFQSDSKKLPFLRNVDI